MYNTPEHITHVLHVYYTCTAHFLVWHYTYHRMLVKFIYFIILDLTSTISKCMQIIPYYIICIAQVID